MKSIRISVILVAIALMSLASQSAHAVVAYEVLGGTAGTQAFGGSLGMDFDVSGGSNIEITRLGVFDDLSDGLNRTINAHIYDRNNTSTPLASLVFGTGATGSLEGGSRFLNLAGPLVLPAGFQGTVVAEGYGAGERNGNVGTGSTAGTTNTGGGLISFVGNARHGTSGLFPTNIDGGPANRYHAGTFDFIATTASPPVPTDAVAYIVPAGTNGNQSFGGSLGMDFNVNEDIRVTQLGVFDSGSDGLNRELTAHIYDRNNPGSPIATLLFTPGDPGSLDGGSRFKSLAGPLILPAGFQGAIVAEGYGAGEQNGNTHGGAAAWSVFPTSALAYVGGGRHGTAGLFPTNLDGGPINRYAAGTFRFDVIAVPEPATAMLSVFGVVIICARRRR